MNGDLSLSGSLGGLRIANPDDEAVLSPVQREVATPGSTDESDTVSIGQRSTSTIRGSRTDLSSSAESTAPAGVTRHNVGYLQDGQAVHSQSHSPSGLQHRPSVGPTIAGSDKYDGLRRSELDQALDARTRPVSAFYNHPNASSASSGSSRDPTRYPSDIFAHQQGGLARATSRSASNPIDTTYPTRETSQRERYRQSQQYPAQQFPLGTGSQVPPRRESRRLSAAPSSQGTGASNGLLKSSEDWHERGAAVTTRQVVDKDGNQTTRIIKKGVRDFNFGRTLGEGSYSTVLAATDRQTGREYAIKVLDKRHIIKEKKVKYVTIEKDTLNRLTDHPGIVRLYYTFQDERSLYYVLDLASGGELLGVLKKTGTFNEECTRYYAAQMLDSIAYMHSRGIIHRDLKPENVLLDSNMHTKITDFGTAKILNISSTPQGGSGAGDPMDGADSDRARSFVGTAEYVSPELLTDKNACKASDLWAFGCIVFQLLAGRPPFKASNEYQTFQKIVALNYQFPEGFPQVAKDLIQKLLVLEPSERLPIEAIKTHSFFEGIHWGRGLWRTQAPKLKAYKPPAMEPIKLNGTSAQADGVTGGKLSAQMPSHNQPAGVRPQLRSVTELPPPSQLDIDWSPVLTRPNERILKMANLLVSTLPLPQSPQQSTPGATQVDNPKKFSRFFGGGTPRKKQRLVMITSTARIIVVAAGGDEKKAKAELHLMTPGNTCRSYQDAKGLTAFCVETKDKQITFEDPSASTADPDGSKYSTHEWMEKIEWAKELAVSQAMANSYSADSQYNDINSAIPSPSTSTGGSENNHEHTSSRNLLRKDTDNDSVRSNRRHRFSKRHSKSGLAAVF